MRPWARLAWRTAVSFAKRPPPGRRVGGGGWRARRRSPPSPSSTIIWMEKRSATWAASSAARRRSLLRAGLSQHGVHSRPQVFGIVRRAEAVAIRPVDFRDAADVGGDRRHPRAGGFEHDVRHRFGPRGDDEHAAEFEGFAHRQLTGERDERTETPSRCARSVSAAWSGPEPTRTVRGISPRARPTRAIASSSVSMPLAARNSPT